MSWDAVLLGTFVAVADCGTLDEAARRLHVTPSAVSQRLKTLEQQAGSRLLVRSKPVRPTETGHVVLRHARRLALLEHDLSADLDLLATGPRTRLGIAVNADSLATWFLDPLARFAAEHEVDLDVRREDQDHTARLLLDGAVAAAVTSRAEPVPGCRVVTLGALEYVPVASPAWLDRWAPDGADASALARGPRVDYDAEDTLQDRWLTEHGAALGRDDPRPARRFVPSSHDFARAVAAGLGWGLLPAQHAGELLDRGEVVALPGRRVRTPLFWQHWSAASSTLDALTDHVVQAARGALGAAQPSASRASTSAP